MSENPCVSTPLNKPVRTALIDWFRFTCLWPADLEYPGDDTLKVLTLLKVEPKRLSQSPTNALGSLNYQATFIYESDVKVGIDPKGTAVVAGCPGQFVIDLSGSACRHFEQRGGDWGELIDGLAQMSVKFNRIDLAMDDIDGVLQVNEIKDKIARLEFTSAFRARTQGGKVCDETYCIGEPFVDDLDEDDEKDNFKVLDTRKGYTATFGSRSNPVLLNIYDKKAEREVNAGGTSAQSWIRFEASFLRHKCESVVRKLLIPAFREKKFGRVIASIIHGLIEFKDTSSSAISRDVNRSMNKLSIWPPYENFLQGVQAIKVPTNQSKVEESVARTIKWATGYWKGSLLKLFGTYSLGMVSVCKELKKKVAKEGIPWSTVCQMTEYYKQNKIEVSAQDVLEQLQAILDRYDLEDAECGTGEYSWDEDGLMDNPNVHVQTGAEHVDVIGAFLYRLSMDWAHFSAALKTEVKLDAPFIDDLDVFSTGAETK